jgi:hypothetical protein
MAKVCVDAPDARSSAQGAAGEQTGVGHAAASAARKDVHPSEAFL